MSIVSEVLQTVLLTVVIFFSVRMVVQNFRVEGGSMEPSLHSGQYLLISKAAYFSLDDTPLRTLNVGAPEDDGRRYLFSAPRRGEIVVFEAPTAAQKDFIKRIIGLPGDEVLITKGRVLVNGKELEEPYVVHKALYDYPSSGRPFKVPAGQYFVLGDNRPNSQDSHTGWTLPAENLIGKAWLSYWPPSNVGVVPAMAYEE